MNETSCMPMVDMHTDASQDSSSAHHEPHSQARHTPKQDTLPTKTHSQPRTNCSTLGFCNVQANDYVESYWDVIVAVVGEQAQPKVIKDFLHEHSVAGGVVALCCIALNILCGHCRYPCIARVDSCPPIHWRIRTIMRIL